MVDHLTGCTRPHTQAALDQSPGKPEGQLEIATWAADGGRHQDTAVAETAFAFRELISIRIIRPCRTGHCAAAHFVPSSPHPPANVAAHGCDRLGRGRIH